MRARGQSQEAWLSRWRDGACPIHGTGFVADVDGPDHTVVRCSKEDCVLRAARWPAQDEHHASFGWIAGPDEIRALFVKAGDIEVDSAKPGRRGRIVRISYRLEE